MIAKGNGKQRTDETRAIEQLLRRRFVGVEAYRYNSASIRVRVIDEQFRGKSEVEREQLVLPLIHELPEETRDDITMLLMLTDGENADSVSSMNLVNLEFDHRSRSML